MKIVSVVILIMLLFIVFAVPVMAQDEPVTPTLPDTAVGFCPSNVMSPVKKAYRTWSMPRSRNSERLTYL